MDKIITQLTSHIDILKALTIPLPGRPAYLDPGSGSYLIQLLLATLLGSLFLLRTYWGRVKAFFQGKPPPDEEEHDNHQTEDGE
jgi:hypothetical protein